MLILSKYSDVSRIIFLSLKYAINFFSIDSINHFFCSFESRLSHSGYDGAWSLGPQEEDWIISFSGTE